MRTFKDTNGNEWQAAVLEASYGSVALVFSPARGDGIRHVAMPVQNLMEAMARLAQMDEARLQQLLEDAEPWDHSHG